MTTPPQLALTDAWTFVLPQGWARFPIGDGRERELDRAIDEVIARVIPADVPRDQSEPVKRLLNFRLRASIAEATGVGASVIYLPIELVNGVVTPASITEIEFDSDPGSDPVAVVASILSDGYDESETVEIDGRPAVRVTSTLHNIEQPDEPTPFSSQQVVYAISRDDRVGSWLALSFSVVWNSPESQRLADALVFFFDAVMTTFRWAGGDHSPRNPGASVPGSAPTKEPSL
jgi:hypothetical protein